MSVFEIITAGEKKELPILATISHSGSEIPDEIRPQFNPRHAESLINTDWHLEKLFDFLPDLGITVLYFKPYKYVANVNRLLKEPYTGEYAKSFLTTSLPKGTPFDWPVYSTLPTEDEVIRRVKKYYNPFHETLQGLIEQKTEQFGRMLLIDLHSCIGSINTDICIGNAHASSSSQNLIAFFESEMIDKGFSTSINDPFSGGYIVRQYGKPPTIEAIMIEIRAGTYMPARELDQGRPATFDENFAATTKNRFGETFKAISDFYCN